MLVVVKVANFLYNPFEKTSITSAEVISITYCPATPVGKFFGCSHMKAFSSGLDIGV